MSINCELIVFVYFQNAQYSKLEKADILELTVKHLRNVQRHQMAGGFL